MIFTRMFLRSICCIPFLVMACTTTRVETAGMPGHYTDEQTPVFGFEMNRKKYKRLSASYPPPGLIDGLKSYRQRYNSWPRTLSDLFNFSLDAQKAISGMLNTHYSNLQTNWQSPDSLEIYYHYGVRTKDQKNKDTQIILNDKSYKRKYVFVYNTKDSSILIENLNLK